ncbi:hypothetical protein L915_11248 [Phytophthora nicotianae]|uniref:Uncharacterized protein n=1 Tax=Phytophthora nicotianae TaxID=4792 RepID=W2GKX9_PHYNI|nr:hypothetical protein L915_11248 [Phytophthora nicotianae]
MTSWRFQKQASVVIHESFYYWLKRNGFTNEELKQVKEATQKTTMYVLAHKLTDVHDAEEMIKLQSIEKQKLVVAVLQQSTAAIIAAHEAEFLVLRVMCARLLFNWGAQDVYKLGNVIGKNGRL